MLYVDRATQTTEAKKNNSIQIYIYIYIIDRYRIRIGMGTGLFDRLNNLKVTAIALLFLEP